MSEEICFIEGKKFAEALRELRDFVERDRRTHHPNVDASVIKSLIDDLDFDEECFPELKERIEPILQELKDECIKWTEGRTFEDISDITKEKILGLISRIEEIQNEMEKPKVAGKWAELWRAKMERMETLHRI